MLFEADHPGGEGAGEYACHLYELLTLERGHEAVEAMDYGASGCGVDHVDRAVQWIAAVIDICLVGLIGCDFVVAAHFEHFDAGVEFDGRGIALAACFGKFLAGVFAFAQVAAYPAYAYDAYSIFVSSDGLEYVGVGFLCIYVWPEITAVKQGIPHILHGARPLMVEDDLDVAEFARLYFVPPAQLSRKYLCYLLLDSTDTELAGLTMRAIASTAMRLSRTFFFLLLR